MIFHSTFKRPVLLVGNGARFSGASDLILEFTKKTDIPVLTTMNAVDLAQDDIHIGFIGTYGNRAANIILAKCDLVISVGARLGLRQVGHIVENFAPKAKLIRVDIDQYELSRDIKSDEEKYLMDAKDFMRQLLNEDIPSYEEWKRTCLELKELLKDADKEIGNCVIEKISLLLPRNPIVAVDVGQNQCWCAQSLSLKGDTGRILISGGYGTMGCGLPYAIGASISENGRPVFCITGDGGLQMNLQELETIKREGLPIKIIVLNNQALGKISEIQLVSYGARFAQTTKESGYTVPDFKKIADAYGIRSVSLESYESLDDYVEWLHDSLPCLINIHIPENSLLIPKIKWETGEIEPKLDTSLSNKIEELFK